MRRLDIIDVGNVLAIAFAIGVVIAVGYIDMLDKYLIAEAMTVGMILAGVVSIVAAFL